MGAILTYAMEAASTVQNFEVAASDVASLATAAIHTFGSLIARQRRSLLRWRLVVRLVIHRGSVEGINGLCYLFYFIFNRRWCCGGFIQNFFLNQPERQRRRFQPIKTENCFQNSAPSVGARRAIIELFFYFSPTSYSIVAML